MNYLVEWTPAAIRMLAMLWLASADRNVVTAAVAAIDQAIAVSPHTVGTLIFDTVYEYTHAPPQLSTR